MIRFLVSTSACRTPKVTLTPTGVPKAHPEDVFNETYVEAVLGHAITSHPASVVRLSVEGGTHAAAAIIWELLLQSSFPPLKDTLPSFSAGRWHLVCE